MTGATRAYAFPALLLVAIAAGTGLGVAWPAGARAIRPVGELFLDLVFTTIVPLVFFTVASSVARVAGTGRLGRIAVATGGVFVGASAVAAAYGLAAGALLFPGLGRGVVLPGADGAVAAPALADAVRGAIAVSDFPELLSRRHVLPLVLAAGAVGLATGQLGDAAAPFARWLDAGSAVVLRVVRGVTWLAPAGLLAWFANTAADTGAQLAGVYLPLLGAYLALAVAWALGAFSAAAAAAGGLPAVRRLWAHALPPILTALGTCSSLATLPVNLRAAELVGVPAEVRELVLPVGAALHKHGSVLAATVKILFLHAAYGRPLDLGAALLGGVVAVACGVVVGGVPTGGMIAEALVVSAFGFPAEALPAIAVIGVLVDPVATALNAFGDVPAAMLVARAAAGKSLWEWLAATPEVGEDEDFARRRDELPRDLER